jgi:hypothetical protein
MRQSRLRLLDPLSFRILFIMQKTEGQNPVSTFENTFGEYIFDILPAFSSALRMHPLAKLLQIRYYR